HADPAVAAAVEREVAVRTTDPPVRLRPELDEQFELQQLLHVRRHGSLRQPSGARDLGAAGRAARSDVPYDERQVVATDVIGARGRLAPRRLSPAWNRRSLAHVRDPTGVAERLRREPSRESRAGTAAALRF